MDHNITKNLMDLIPMTPRGRRISETISEYYELISPLPTILVMSKDKHSNYRVKNSVSIEYISFILFNFMYFSYP